MSNNSVPGDSQAAPATKVEGPAPTVDPDDMRRTLAGFATGLAVVAAENEGAVVGMPVNSLVSVSLDPPLVSLSFAHTSSTWPLLKRAQRWGISVLSEDAVSVSRDLRRPTTERFSGLDVDVVDGAVFLRGALAKIGVTLQSEIQAGDHTLVLLNVISVERDESSTPLVFYNSKIRTLAA
ncbi:flavin reductase family protein [Microbacterium trichothecenolyticum]|uniref:FMN reductase (NADH) NtaB n=1 Tax=Microbacterium trichothecenolyticum TaxID=69370 RepID=A0A0M2HDM6_MICTR|nr:flavin reductase family protein [Microbacterium trichothecenolyticum]KJL42287.1 FMN reductase (NADH) NtaB [Microbacterium trichothecenolyticum]